MKDEKRSKNQLLTEISILRKQIAELNTQLKEKEEFLAEIRKSEKRLHFLFEFAPDAYYLSDLKGNFIEVNKAVTQLLGFSKEELIDKNFFRLKILPSDQLPKARFNLNQSSQGRSTGPDEFMFNRKDGSEIALEIRTQPVEINGDRVVLGLARDISQRKAFEKEEEKHREFLEQLVKERTANLMATNTKLQREIREREHREHALRESEERYKELVEKAGIGILIDDEQGNLKYFNKRLADIFGYSCEEMKEQNILNLIHAEDLEMVLNYHRKRYLGLEIESMYEFRGVKKDGAIRSLEVHASEIRNNGKITGTRSFIWDHTEKKLAEEAHRKSEQRYHQLFSNMRDAAAVFDITGRIIEFNPVFQEMTGYSPKTIYNLTTKDLTPAEWNKFENKIIKDQVLKRGYSDVYQKELIINDGTKIPVELRTYLIRDDQNQPEAIWSIIRDITNRKRIETEMRMLAHAVKSIRECVTVTDLNNTILFVNEAFKKTYGYKDGELIGKNVAILRSAKNSEELVKQILPETMRGGWEGELLNKRKNGQEFPVYVSTSVIHDENDNPIALIGVAADITERKKIEDQLRQAQKMDAVGKLAGGIAHDFNNILSVISGYTEMALRDLTPDQTLYKRIKQVYVAGEKAGNLVRQLLAFSRKQMIEPKIVDINQLIEDLDKILIRLIGEDIETIVYLGDHIGLIKADPSQLEQVFFNLIVNARDAINQKTDIASEKKIIIETENVVLDKKFIEEHRGSTEGKHVLITITDTGIGMDENTREKIFEPFFTTKTEGRGTGLGLSTVYGIVKQNNGSIYVESKNGQGSSFKIYWPIVETEGQAQKIEKKDDKIIGGTENILIVEDESQVRDVAVEALQSIGYKTYEACNGIEALTLLKEATLKIDLVITDVIMPGMGGQELAENIMKFKPELKILFTSGYTDHKIEKNGKLFDEVNFLHKPYSIIDLSKKVRELIEN